MKTTLLLITISACLLGGCSNMMTTEQQDKPDSGWLANVFPAEPPQDEQDIELEDQPENPLIPLSSADKSVNFHNQMQGTLLNKQQKKVQHEQLRQPLLTKNINHYVRGLMQDMAGNLQYVNATTPVAVASFVFLDASYDSSSLLGNQIAESFIHEIRKFNIPVLDFKTTGWLMVTPGGDFAQSRDYQELSSETQISYVVTGTLVKHQGGILVNARMVDMKSKVVVASAQSLIPNEVADALTGSHNNGSPQIQTESAAPAVSLVQG
jgi:TolB-like protein